MMSSSSRIPKGLECHAYCETFGRMKTQYEHHCANPIHAVNGFIASSILQSIDPGKPVLTNAAIQQAEESDDTEDDYESEQSDMDSSEDEIM